MATTIVFDGANVRLHETAVTATLGRSATPRLSWTATAGGIVDGAIERRVLHGGITAAGGVSWLALYETSARPFIAVTGTFGTAWIRGVADDGSTRSWTAFDLRGGAMIGKTFADRFVPYAAVRGFGGPVFWYRGGGSVTGGDRYHVTAGAGLTIRLPKRLDATLEVMPVGEQSGAAAVTARF